MFLKPKPKGIFWRWFAVEPGRGEESFQRLCGGLGGVSALRPASGYLESAAQCICRWQTSGFFFFF